MSLQPGIDGVSPPVVGVLLAGGRSRRMAVADKCLLDLGGRTLLDRVVERVRPQVRHLILNANGSPGRFARYGLPVVPDGISGYPGPLAGVLAGIEWAWAEAPDCPWIATFPADTPFIPQDLVERLLAAIGQEGAVLAVAESGGRRHPLSALWPVSSAEALRVAIVEEGVRKVGSWQAGFRAAVVRFDTTSLDPFFNVNEPGDLKEAERKLRIGRML